MLWAHRRPQRHERVRPRSGSITSSYLTTDSQLIVAPIDACGVSRGRRYNVATSTTYAHPIVLRDRVIVRDESHVGVMDDEVNGAAVRH